MIQIGVRAHDFGKQEPHDLFMQIADAGFEAIQLALPKAVAGVNSFDDVNLEVVNKVAKALDDSGLKLAVLGCYLDLTTNDESLMQKNIQTTEKILKVAKDLGAHCVASESTYGKVAAQDRKEYMERLISMVVKVLTMARSVNIPYALEPVFYHALASKELFLQLAHSVGRDHLQVIYDPTNLMDPKYLNCQEQYIASCLAAFAPYADIIHIKDFKVNEDCSYSPCRLGDGSLQVETLRAYLAKCAQSNLYLIREELDPVNAFYEVKYLKELLGRSC